MSAGAAGAAGGRSPLAELLHALNQPLTGLQCSLEVTLAAPRTAEHYQRILRDGLGLTERMRLLVEALRDVAEAAGAKSAGPAQAALAAAELQGVVRGLAEELRPVAEAKQVRITLGAAHGSATLPGKVETRGSPFAPAVFRALDSALSLAASGSEMCIEAEPELDGGGFRLRWQNAPVPDEEVASAFSRPELGLFIARAQLEARGAECERRTTDHGDILAVRFTPVQGLS